MHGFNW
jgi:hypothetical protein